MKQVDEIELRKMIRNKQDMTCINTSGVVAMNWLFTGEKSFNQNISNWDVSNVNNMYQMFGDAENFNQDISNWNVGNILEIGGMFKGAEAFIEGRYFMKTMLSWSKQLSITTGELIDIVLGG